MASVLLPAGLVVLRGPSGCGKSTLAARLAAEIGDTNAVVSTDAIRTEVCGDATDLSRDDEVFALRNRRVASRLRAGLPTIADATHLAPASIRTLVTAAEAAGMPVAVVNCVLPINVALSRNASRDRVVSPEMIRRQFSIYTQHNSASFEDAGADVVCESDQVRGWAPTGVDGARLNGPFDIIGDVHGQLTTLLALLEELGYDENWKHPQGRILVFVGDLVDKGPDPIGVLDAVMDAHRRGRALMVRGNHEQKLCRRLAAIDGASSTASQRRKALLEEAEKVGPGSALTLRAFAADDRCVTGFSALVRWISRLPTQLVLDDAKLVVVHSAIRSDDIGRTEFTSNSARRKAENWNLYGPSSGVRDPLTGHSERVDWVQDWDGSATIVRGHVTVDEPELRNHVASIDVGAGGGVALASFRWPEQTFVSTQVRTDAALAV